MAAKFYAVGGILEAFASEVESEEVRFLETEVALLVEIQHNSAFLSFSFHINYVKWGRTF